MLIDICNRRLVGNGRLEGNKGDQLFTFFGTKEEKRVVCYSFVQTDWAK